MKRILLVAEQPWQIEVAAILAIEIRRIDSKYRILIAATDYYTFLHEPKLIHKCKENYNTEIATLADLFQKWQNNDEPDCRLIDYQVKDWLKNIVLSRSVYEIERTNQLIFGWERVYYFLQVTDAWRKKIFSDSINWSENLINKFRPNLVIAIERNTLVNNLIFEISVNKQIPHVTFIQSRIENRWIPHDNFGLGITHPKKKFKLCNHASLENGKIGQKYIDHIRKGGKPYNSFANDISKVFGSKFVHRIPYILGKKISPFVPTVNTLLKMAYLRLTKSKNRFDYKVIRLEENLIKLTLFELRQIIFYRLRLLGIKHWGSTKKIESQYFFWALHSRPEDSTSVLGLGIDELDEIAKVVKLLPDNIVLVVKEHPLMFGLRSKEFYSKLKSYSNLVLVDAFQNTRKLLLDEKCLGAIGLSGTILLESELIGKPSFAIGIPEFLESLSSFGDDVKNYLDKAAAGQYSDIGEKVVQYVKNVMINSSEFDVPYLSPTENSLTQEMLKRWARMIVGFDSGKS
jgi:hypothetical protein